MSEDLTPKVKERKIAPLLKTGIHLVIVSKIAKGENADKTPILVDGFKTLIVTFKSGDGHEIDQLYVMDKGIRQKYLINLFSAVGIHEQTNVPVGDVKNKRLWVAVKEVHHVNDDEIILDDDKKPLIDYYVFRVFPYIEPAGVKPGISGDPEKNHGIASGDFISYKNHSTEETSFIEAAKPAEEKDIVFELEPEHKQLEEKPKTAIQNSNDFDTPVTKKEEIIPLEEEEEELFPDTPAPIPEGKGLLANAIAAIAESKKEPTLDDNLEF